MHIFVYSCLHLPTLVYSCLLLSTLFCSWISTKRSKLLTSQLAVTIILFWPGSFILTTSGILRPTFQWPPWPEVMHKAIAVNLRDDISNCKTKTIGKCFTYLTKTVANLTTYSRKPGDYRGTIIFEIDIMKISSPLNLKFTFFATVKTKITLLFCWTHSTLSSASKCDRENQNKRKNQKNCEKVKFDKDSNWLGMSFSWYQSQK